MAGRIPIFEWQEASVENVLPHFALRDQALIVMGLNTGFRIREILSLDVGQVWQEGGVRPSVTVARARLKGGRGIRKRAVHSRTVPLNERVRTVLGRYLTGRFSEGHANPTEPLFMSRRRGFRLSRWQANRIVHAVFAAAGLPERTRYGTHSLRKTFARRVYEATGHDINLTRAIMGHTEVTTTQRYLHVDEAEMTATVLALGAPAAAVNSGLQLVVA